MQTRTEGKIRFISLGIIDLLRTNKDTQPRKTFPLQIEVADIEVRTRPILPTPNLRRASQVYAHGTDYIRESNSNYINFTTVEISISDSCEDQTILCWAVLLEPNCQLARRNFARHTRRHPSAKPFDLIRDDLSLLPRIPTELRVCQAYQNVSSTNSALRATYGCVT
jgi:hypothetical protein